MVSCRIRRERVEDRFCWLAWTSAEVKEACPHLLQVFDFLSYCPSLLAYCLHLDLNQVC